MFHTMVVVQVSVQILNWKKPYLNFCTWRAKFQNDAVFVNLLLCLYETYHTMIAVRASVCIHKIHDKKFVKSDVVRFIEKIELN